MSKYLKLFETTSQYEAYINGSDVVLPNVSVAKDAPTTVYYSPYVPPRMDIITYEASAKLTETTDSSMSGLRPNAFSGTSGQLTMTKHTFESGVGTIEFDGDVTSIGNNAFRYSSGLTSITIPDSVTSIGNDAFSNCSGLTNIIIPDSVTSIGGSAFAYCTGLTSITIPDGVTSIGQSAFLGCSGLTNIIIPDSVTSIGGSAFSGCSGLTSIIVDSANTVYDSRDNCNAIINTSTNELIVGCKNTIIPNSVTTIGGAFYRCSGLTSITIPDSVTSIGTSAFRGCSSLTSITSNATTAPTIQSNTFMDVKTGGTLTVPSGSTGYNVWMGTGKYYLGKYRWTKVEQ